MESSVMSQQLTLELIKDRWSPRAFSTRPVETEKLARLFEAARWAPSGMNSQPWNFVLVNLENPAAHERMVEVLSPRNQLWAQHAPVLMLAIAKTEREPGKPNRYAWYDLGQAVAQLSVQATAEGLSLHQMGGFDAEKARQAFGIPQGYEAVTAIALGYLGDPDSLPEDFRAREGAPRSRKPLNELVFENTWGQPFQENE